MPKIKNSTLAIVLIALVSIAIGLFVQESERSSQELPEFSSTIILPTAKPLAAFQLTDHEGRAFDQRSLLGHWNILFFGFTNCPDICPTTLQTLKNVKQRMTNAGNWGNYRVIMVSVDPQRDTPQTLKNYVPYFDPQFLGVSGDLAVTEAFARQVGVLFVARESENSSNYQVDHSAALILINPAGEWAGVISAPHQTDKIVSDLGKLAAHFENIFAYSEKVDSVRSHAAAATGSLDDSRIAASALSLRKAWIRPAPPNSASMAAYFELHNSSDSDIQIVATESPAFESVMIHDTVINDGVASMRHRPIVVVPAGGTLELAPMATHMMLINPKQNYAVGSRIEISLQLAGGAELKQEIVVRKQHD